MKRCCTSPLNMSCRNEIKRKSCSTLVTSRRNGSVGGTCAKTRKQVRRLLCKMSNIGDPSGSNRATLCRVIHSIQQHAATSRKSRSIGLLEKSAKSANWSGICKSIGDETNATGDYIDYADTSSCKRERASTREQKWHTARTTLVNYGFARRVVLKHCKASVDLDTDTGRQDVNRM